eukprot:TRINITY_DN20252_c2_g1_i1.p1 TRINITY_DN20252_c2_g1~~TRINITY_DN20252_c2_g1_i1.p1  ORF type:complete len:597 (+),score=109.02 TRINITY_DN20252_c2_g1_i1:55-1845(+)
MEKYWISVLADKEYFKGTIKESIEDFKVNEIDEDGNLVEYTGAKALPPMPTFAKDYQNATKSYRQAANSEADNVPVVEEELPPLSDLVGPDISKKIEAGELPVDITTSMTREERILLNKVVKTTYPKYMMNNTGGVLSISLCPAFEVIQQAFGEDDAMKIVRFTVSNAPRLKCSYQTTCKQTRKEFHEMWPTRFGFIKMNASNGVVTFSKKADKVKRKGCEAVSCYTMFTLCKSDLSWQEACRQIAISVGLKEGDIHCAGMKDKKAITVQRCCAKGIVAQKLLRISHDKVKICDITYSTTPIQSGTLSGNKFIITLRNITPSVSNDVFQSRCGTVFSSGFPNFFGHQRFAFFCQSDKHIAHKMLKGQWNEAVNILMEPTAEDKEAVVTAKNEYKDTGDCRKVAKLLPTYKSTERELMWAKERYPSEDDGAKWFTAVGYATRELWFHMLQSWVWNKVLTKRLEKYGTKVLKGDLIMQPLSVHGKADKGVPLVCTEPSDFTIFHVVHPKPGCESMYPDNEVAKLFDDVLSEYGLTRIWKSSTVGVRLSASYRHLFTKPADGASAELINEGKDARLTFSLPLSCYATVLLGEVMGSPLL